MHLPLSADGVLFWTELIGSDPDNRLTVEPTMLSPG